MPPSGRQFCLRLGDQEAVIAEVGATLREYRAGERHLIDGFPPGERSRDGRGQILLPWPNRIRDGRYIFAGQEQQLPINEVGPGNAIHGLARWLPWTLREVTAETVTLSLCIPAQPGYEHSLHATAHYELSDDGLIVVVQADNRGEAALPFGLGFHPYLMVPNHQVDDLLLHLPATLHLLADSRGIPTGERIPVESSEYDFTVPRPIGSLHLDATFTGLITSATGETAVTLVAPEGSPGVRLWAGQAFSYLQVFTGDSLQDPNKRRRALAVEPMTCPPDAFRSGTGLIILDPGASFTARWGIQPI
ncbi:MAG: aldose 1-epimerase family protein [Candidatus Dormibacteraeota bacterium]|nr:aldose 1-epimerase family protein [Candidatus Dormibacteraeota bacterium]